MAFNRTLFPGKVPSPDALTAAMAGIGMNFAVEPDWEANIEDTLLFASKAGMDNHDHRVLSVMVTWLGVYAQWVNADRLTRIVTPRESPRVRAFWSSVSRRLEKDRRFNRLCRVYDGPPVDLLPIGTDFQIKRHGEDSRLAGGPLRIPANALRDRPADVIDPAILSRRHRVYRWRVIMGPTYRADMWAALEQNPMSSPAELARATYGSFATAWRVRRDFLIVYPAQRLEAVTGA